MKKILIVILLITTTLFSNSLDNLLKEYEITTENSLKTVDEKLGHVLIYSQKEIRMMQYSKLSDILKELPLVNLNTNRFGLSSPSLAGSKTTTSGFFRFFINDHEISSSHTKSASLSWGDLPLDFIDHVEIYYGESSFTQGNETGIYFIRLYTKSAAKENGGELKATMSDRGDNSQSITTSQVFQNGWSYLLFLHNDKSNKTMDYSNQTLQNNGDRKNLYLDISNENTNINLGYSHVKKDTYMGLSLDVVPDDSTLESEDFFIDISKYLLEDKSLKASFSVDVTSRKMEEKNAQGIGLTPVIDLANIGTTLPKEFVEDIKFTKLNAYISKSFQFENNNLLTAFNVKNLKYTTKNIKTVNFLNQENNVAQYNDFDEESVYSFLFQDDYKVHENLILLANAKVDKYVRSGYLEDSTEKLFRLGAIYTPFKNFGLKSFYTKTYLPVSFYNADFVDKNNINLKSQKYDIYTLEGVYAVDKSRFSMTYHNVTIDDFIYLSPIGFINVNHPIKTQGLIFDYEYNFSDTSKLHLNYYAIKLSENINNSDKGGYIKYIQEYDRFSYFASLLYKSSYQFLDIDVRDSFDLSLGLTYNFSKDLSMSVKGVNLLDKSTQSLYSKGFPVTYFALDDYQRSVYVSMKWLF